MGRGRDNEVQSFALHEVLRNEALHTQYETHGRKGKPLLGSLRHLAPSARGLSTKLTGGEIFLVGILFIDFFLSFRHGEAVPPSSSEEGKGWGECSRAFYNPSVSHSSSLYTREPMLTLRDNESFTYELRNDR